MKEKNERINFQYFVEYDMEESNPGCSGCRPSDGEDRDYCRCGRIDDVKIKEESIDHLCLAQHFLETVGDKPKKKGKQISNNDIMIYCMDRIFRHMDLDADSFSWVGGGGYYGEELEGIYLKEHLEEEARKHYEELIAFHTVTEKINYVLINEYGFLLPKIKDGSWDFQWVKSMDIVIPNTEYYQKKLDKKLIKKYKEWQLPICLIDQDNKIIDGYHRYTANRDLEMMYVLKLVKETK